MSRSRARTGPGGGEQAILTGCCGELAEAGAEDEASLHVPSDEPMMFEGHREAMSGRPREPRACDEAGQCGGSWLERGEHESGFVENADSARVVHVLILPYRIVRRKCILVGVPRGTERS